MKSLWKVFLLLLLCAPLSALSALSADAEPFQVGVIVPLTGPLADFGQATQNGILLAQEESPRLFKAVRFLSEDAAFDSRTALQAFYKLRDSDGVDAVFVWGTGPAQALSPVAESAEFPLVVVSAETGLAAGKTYVLRFFFESKGFASPLVAYLRSKGFETLGVVKSEIVFFEEVLDALRSELRDGEHLTVVDSFPPHVRDFKSTLTRLKKSDFDAVGVFLVSGQIRSFFRQAHTLSLQKPVFGTNMFESYTEVANSSDTMLGAVYPTIGVTASFRARYRKRFGSDVQVSFAALSYDFAMLVAQYARTVEGDPDGFLGFLREPKAHKGAIGEFRYVEASGGGEFQLPIVVRRVEKDGFVDIERGEP